MHTALLVVALAATPAPDIGFSSMEDAARSLAKNVQTGTLLVSKGDCLAIKAFTQSPYTHVAAVVIRHGQPFVYDSANGFGVRCQTLENYLRSQSPDEIYLFHPKKPFSKSRARRFEQYLDSQLGKPYAIKHHLTGERAAGVHCAEFVTDSLEACNLVRAKQPARVSPASLVAGIQKANLYKPAKTIRLTKPSAPARDSDSWCYRLWLDTKQCTGNCCFKLKRWILCR